MSNQGEDSMKPLNQSELLEALSSTDSDSPGLEELLAGSDKLVIRLTDEDREWVGAAPVGRERL